MFCDDEGAMVNDGEGARMVELRDVSERAAVILSSINFAMPIASGKEVGLSKNNSRLISYRRRKMKQFKRLVLERPVVRVDRASNSAIYAVTVDVCRSLNKAASWF